MQRIQFFPVKTELQCLKHLGIQLFELDKSIREGFRKPFRVFVHELLRGLVRGGVHDELRIVLSALLRGVGGLEAGRCTTFERGDGTHSFVPAQHGIDRIGHLDCFGQSRSFRQVDFYGELVTFRAGHHAPFDLTGIEHRGEQDGGGHAQRQPRMTEDPAEQPIVYFLHMIRDAFMTFPMGFLFNQRY